MSYGAEHDLGFDQGSRFVENFIKDYESNDDQYYQMDQKYHMANCAGCCKAELDFEMDDDF